MELLKGKRQRKRAFKFALIGFTLFSLAYMIHAFNPLELIVDHYLSIYEGSYLFGLFKKPPLDVFISVYIFNITNLDRFLSGQDKKINLQEVGPYVYQEFLENHNATFNANNTLTYRPVRRVEFVPEKSIGDPRNTYVTVPNIPYMGVTAAASKISYFAAMAVRALMNTMNSEIALNMTVYDYLWGYDDPLIQLASTFLPSDIVNFNKFGLLDRMFDEGDNIVTINLPKSKNDAEEQKPVSSKLIDVNYQNTNINDVTSESRDDLIYTSEPDVPFDPVIRDYSMDNYNGLSKISFWGKKTSSCNALRGSYDGTLFPRNITKNERFNVYRKPFCRTLPIVYSHPGTVDGVDAYFFKLADNAFDSSLDDPESSCYCKENKCLKKGLGNVTPCYYNIPAAVSFPHFFNGDPSLFNGIDGLSPDEKKHGSEIVLQPQLGVPMRVYSRMQINLLMDEIKFNSKMKPFSNIALPLIWIQIGLDSLTPELIFILKMLFNVCPYLQTGTMYLFLIVGISLLGMSGLVFFCIPKPTKEFQPKKDIRYSAIYLFPYIKRELSKQSDESILKQADNV